VTYTLDADGRVSKVAAVVNGSSVNLASSITYLPFGPITGLTYGNSLTFSGTFEQDYNPTNRTVSGSIYNWTYATDSNGNVKQAGSTTYGFDALNRVNAENPGTSVSYTYDATSNRLTKGSTTTTVPATSNKISAVGSKSYTYDAAGDITGDGVNTYTWNAAGQLGVVKVGGTTVGTYTYDMFNRRAKKVAATTTYYVYGPGGLLYGEYTSAGALIREYIYLNGQPLAQVDTGTPEFATYLHPDHLGTPRFGTNSLGTQVWAWTNDAFGTSTPTGTATANVRMSGQYYDSESGLFYNINRTYNPAIGRYISSDPIGLAGGINPYSYVLQNPVNAIDIAGLLPLKYLPAYAIAKSDLISRLRCYVQSLTLDEATTLVEDLAKIINDKDIDLITSLPNVKAKTYESTPPDSLVNLTKDEKELMTKYLDSLPAADKSAVDKIKDEACHGNYRCVFKKKDKTN